MIQMEQLQRSKYIQPASAIKALKNYSSAVARLKAGARIYRGLRYFNKTYALVKPSNTERTSKNTKNIYTALMDCLPSWHDYPKRSRSIICSSSTDYADKYTGPRVKYSNSDRIGSLYCILPKNGGRIGICPDDDIWNSFPIVNMRWQTDHMDGFNRLFAKIFYDLYANSNVSYMNLKHRRDIDEMNGDEMKQFLEEAEKELTDIESALEHIENKVIVSDIRNNKLKGKKTWTEYFDGLLNPKKNGFTLQTIEEYSVAKSSEYEVWTDSDCLMICMSYFNKAGERIGSDFRNVNAFFKRATGKESNLIKT